MNYDNNIDYWSGRYEAPNCENFIFRFYGRILKFDFGIDGSKKQKVFDFGCGEGGALKFFHNNGFDVYGADIAKRDLVEASANIGGGSISNHFELIDPVPRKNQKYLSKLFGESPWIDIFISIQTLDFLSDSDCEIVLNNVKNQMKPGSVIYASFNGYQMYYRNHATYIGDGLWHVKFKNDRVNYDLNLNFIETKEKLIEKFHMFKCKYVDYYDLSFQTRVLSLGGLLPGQKSKG